MPFRFDILTLFPEIFDSYLGQSLVNKAIEKGLIQVDRWNIRDWAEGRHHKVDDRPYGGGPGMVIMPGPVFGCVDYVRQAAEPAGELILLTPRGERFNDAVARELATKERLLLLCGRYEGFDERIHEGLGAREVSIGDFVTNGGEVPAMAIIDAVVRFVPGVLGDEESAAVDSFARPEWVEYPQYTRPPEFRGQTVPEVLLSGDHEKIARWREQEANRLSTERRRRQKGSSDVR